MTPREAAEVILAVRQASHRTGQRFVVDHDRLRMFGLSDAEIEQVEMSGIR